MDYHIIPTVSDPCSPTAVLWITTWINLFHQQRRKLLCLMWNGSRVKLCCWASGSQGYQRTLKLGPDATSYILLWHLFYSLYPSLPPVPSPSPVSPGFAHLWILTLPTTSVFSSLPLLSSTGSTAELLHLVPHPGHIHTAPWKPVPPSLLAIHSFSFLYSTLTKWGKYCENRRETSCPWFWCGSGLSDEQFQRASCTSYTPSSRPRQVSGRCCAITCALCTCRQKLWGHD